MLLVDRRLKLFYATISHKFINTDEIFFTNKNKSLIKFQYASGLHLQNFRGFCIQIHVT